MALLPIKIYPDPILKKRAEEVKSFDRGLGFLLDNMAETMYQAPGIGLAANQVGVLLRVVVIDVSKNENDKLEAINPKIIWRSGSVDSEEGCLSIPHVRENVTRDEEIVVQMQDRSGQELELKASGLLAICFQHEIDHLDGILFIDRLSRLKREIVKKKYLKALKEES